MMLHHDIERVSVSKTWVFCHANLRLSLVNKTMPPDGRFMSISSGETIAEPDMTTCCFMACDVCNSMYCQ